MELTTFADFCLIRLKNGIFWAIFDFHPEVILYFSKMLI